MKGMGIMTLLRTRRLRAVITAWLGLFFFFGLGSAIEAEEITDRDITWEVMEKLLEDEWVSSHFIDVETNAGIETLAGLTHLDVGLAVVCSLGAAITVTIMTIIGLPVSTSQAAVGR
jgi:hypothetical protein